MPTSTAVDYSVQEPTEFQDIFCCGLHRIEILGPNARFILYADGPRWHGAKPSRVLLPTPIVAPIEAIPPAVRLMAAAVAERWGITALGLLMPS